MRVALVSLLFVLAACKTGGGEGGADSAVLDAPGENGTVEAVTASISSREASNNRTRKTAKVKFRGGREGELTRCHQDYIQTMPTQGSRMKEVLVCRDGQTEFVMDAGYEVQPRFARIRFQDGSRPAALSCTQLSEQQRSSEGWDAMYVQRCEPMRQVPAPAQAFFQAVDTAQPIDPEPTHPILVQTMWAQNPPRVWAGDWDAQLARVLPPGEYTGFGSTQSRVCKVVVAPIDGGVSVTILGANGRRQASVEATDKTISGGVMANMIPQKVSSAARPANVMILGAETETTTQDYYSRNLRVVRFPNAPANADAGHTAVFINDNYCQRLQPQLPAW